MSTGELAASAELSRAAAVKICAFCNGDNPAVACGGACSCAAAAAAGTVAAAAGTDCGCLAVVVISFGMNSITSSSKSSV